MSKTTDKKINKILSGTYSQMLAMINNVLDHKAVLDHAKEGKTNALKASSKRLIKKTAEATGNFI